MNYPRGNGIYVPGQMTVTGFDGIPEALNRGLTTVAQPNLDKGRRAGELLHWFNGHLSPSPAASPKSSMGPPRSGLPVVEVLNTELIRGRTAGPPA